MREWEVDEKKWAAEIMWELENLFKMNVTDQAIKIKRAKIE